jgi:hypothetical protein
MAMIGLSDDLSHSRRLLIGSYLTAEYSIESAALFNPSIVPHHNQRNLPAGAVRFIMSLRATGEGHVSSIVLHRRPYSAIRSKSTRQRHLPPVRVVPGKQYDKTSVPAQAHNDIASRVRGPRAGPPADSSPRPT